MHGLAHGPILAQEADVRVLLKCLAVCVYVIGIGAVMVLGAALQ